MIQVYRAGSRARSQESSEVENRKKETGAEEGGQSNIFFEKSDIIYISAVPIPSSIHTAGALYF